MLQQWSGPLPIAIRDRVGAHIGEGLDGERRIEAALGREGRAADDEEVRDIPALAVAVHYRGPGIAAHARAALVVSGRSAGALRRAPYPRRAHCAAELLDLVHHEFGALELVRPPPIVGQPRRGQAPGIATLGSRSIVWLG